MSLILEFDDLDNLQEQLENLSNLHLIIFAAAYCERIYPRIEFLLSQTVEQGWKDENTFKVYLDKIWELLLTNVSESNNFPEKTVKIELIEQSLQSYYSNNINHLVTAAKAIEYTLELCLNYNLDRKNIEHKVFLTIELLNSILIDLVLESLGDEAEDFGQDDWVEYSRSHPLILREMEKVNQDLLRLQDTQTLSIDLLDWLRTSSRDIGKTLIELSK
jgi:uncharacterized protein YjaG (DUF416 family)